MNPLNFTQINTEGAQKVVELLQQYLADIQVYYTNLRGFHWNITGKGFFVLHSKFEEMYDDISEKADEVAERILMLGGVPKNKYSDYLKISNIKEVDNINCSEKSIANVMETITYLMQQERAIISIASEYGDEVTVAQMGDYLREQEKLIWMLCAYSDKQN